MELEEIKSRMHEGKIYFGNDERLMEEQLQYLDRLYDFNQTRPTELKKREEMLKEMFAEIGEGCYIEPPLYANWGGKHVHFGSYVYANFCLSLVDDSHIYVGDHVMFAPRVTVAAGTHPIHPGLRSKQAQYNMPVHIANNVWVGAYSVILPGVSIGDNSVIGAGSVVTKDIPANVVAVGNPCKVLREIGERDLEYYHRNLLIDL